ncbi:hypothetical protein JCM5350_001122, partial [Sporobolomyces pararoseus]
MLAQDYPPDSPGSSPTSTSTSTSSSNDNSDSTKASTTINPLYTRLHPPEQESKLVVQDQFDYSNPISSIKQQQSSTMFATPLEGPNNAGGNGGVLLEEIKSSPSTMTITPSSRSSPPLPSQQLQSTTSSSRSPNDDEGDGGDDGATTTRVSHDERDHLKSKLHSLKLDAKEKLARVGLSHDSTAGSATDVSNGHNVVDQQVTDRLDRPLGIELGTETETETETEGEYLSGEETETENEATRRSGAPRLSRIDTMDSQATSTTGDGGASFYSAESDLEGANSTVESLNYLEPRRSESPVSFTVDGTSPPRLDPKSANGFDRLPVAYANAPGYVPTNSRLVPVSAPPSNRPSSPTLRTSSPSPKIPSSPRLSIPLPYVSSSTASPLPPSSSSHTSNRLVPTASIVKPSTSHPSLAHLSSSQQSSQISSSNHLPPARRASTTSPTLHPPPTSSFASSSPSRRGSSASTLLRPNTNAPQPPPSTSSFPQRSLSASQLTPSGSSATISQNLFPMPQHSSTYPPPLSSPAQSPSLSRGGGMNQTVPSIHDDVESSIAAQAEQIRRQRLEKRQAAEAAERRLNEALQEQQEIAGGSAVVAVSSSGKEKGKGREEDGGGGILRTPTMAMRRNSTQPPLPVQQSQRHLSTSTSARSRSGSGLGLGFGGSGGGGGDSREPFDLQGGSALSTTSLALPLAPPVSSTPGTSLTGPSSTSLAPPVGIGRSPSLRSGSGSGFPHARSGSGGSSLLRGDRNASVEGSSPLGAGAGGRRSVSGESAISQQNQPPVVQPPSSSSSASTLSPLHPTSSSQPPSSQPLARPSSSAGVLQRTHSQAPTVSYTNNNEKLIDGAAEKGEEGTGGAGVPLVGNLIGTDHENYVLMYNMLTGIRIGVSRCQAKAARPLTDADYTARHKFSFDIVGNELTPSVRYDFKFKDYAPWVFRELREYFFLDPSDYLISLTAKYILSELGSPGKSGSFFYFSRDYRFIIKTIRHAEHKFLRKILKEYHEHVKKNPHTLLSRFYGLHRVKLPHGRKIHFVIMNNLFPPHRDIHETYDLKGSSVGRLYP